MPFLKELTGYWGQIDFLYVCCQDMIGALQHPGTNESHLKNVLILRRIQPKIFLTAKCSVVYSENLSNNLIKQEKLRNCQSLWSTWGFTKITRLVFCRCSSSGRKFTAGPGHRKKTSEMRNWPEGNEAGY